MTSNYTDNYGIHRSLFKHTTNIGYAFNCYDLTNVQHTYDREKKLVEKYDVSTTGTGGGGGEYPLQDGFGWTNGVTLKMLDLVCPKEKPCDNVPQTQPASASQQPAPAEQKAAQ